MKSASAPVLLELTCPAADDRDLSELLATILELTSATWAELRLKLDGATTQRRFRRGVTAAGDPGIEVALPRCGDFAAHLVLGLQRPPQAAALRLVGFALNQVLLARKFLAQASLLRSALDTTSSAVLLFDASGAIVYANPKGDELLSEQTAQPLLVAAQPGRPVPLITYVCRGLEQVANSDDRGGGGSRETLTLTDGSIVVCELLQVRTGGRDASRGVLVLLQRIKERGSPKVDAIAAAHNLSPRETEVTQLLIEGHTTAAIADRLGISSHTVRDHLKHVFKKTSTRSRNELVCRLTAVSEL